MKIGIDVSQLAYQNTGVANYLGNLLKEIVKDDKHEYVLFFSSLRGSIPDFVHEISKKTNVTLKRYNFPPLVLQFLWNGLHKFPIENFVGDVDVFITSDWTEPPAKKAKKATILYDLIVYKFPNETDKQIISVQKQKLLWVKRESSIVFCISESTKKDAQNILGLDKEKLKVIHPGLTL